MVRYLRGLNADHAEMGESRSDDGSSIDSDGPERHVFLGDAVFARTQCRHPIEEREATAVPSEPPE